MHRWILLTATVGLAVVTITRWVVAAEYQGFLPEGNYEPQEAEVWMLSGPDAEPRRRAMLHRARVSIPVADAARFDRTAIAPIRPELRDEVPTCRFLDGEPSGTSPKFDCVFDGGAVAKVKYGRNPEIHAEVAASRLLRMLGYAADSVVLVPRLRCYGCPRYPFLTMHLRSSFGIPLLPLAGAPEGYTDFEWVSVERKFPARPIETASIEGWSWWELEAAGMPRPDLDGLRLTAMFLAHWDNKASNQRLVCLDDPLPPAGDDCARPLALIQDLGATFGPPKVNLAQWRRIPVWHDRRTCTISMRAFPFRGASFPDARVSEAGRAQLASRLAGVSDADLEQLFAAARFPQFQAGTDDAGDLVAWTAAFRHRAAQIINARCPDSGGTPA